MPWCPHAVPLMCPWSTAGDICSSALPLLLPPSGLGAVTCFRACFWTSLQVISFTSLQQIHVHCHTWLTCPTFKYIRLQYSNLQCSTCLTVQYIPNESELWYTEICGPHQVTDLSQCLCPWPPPPPPHWWLVVALSLFSRAVVNS